MRQRSILVATFFLLLGAGFVAAGEKEISDVLENLHWLGHDSFRWETSRTVYFDPWKLPPGSKKADIILISHEHFDHFSSEDIKQISTQDTVIIGPAEVIRKLSGQRFPFKEIKTLSAGDSLDVSGVSVHAVASYNVNKAFHTKESGKLGYVVASGGVKVYHPGDADFIPEMKNLECDIALLPVSGTYVMTAQEAAQAALAIKPKVVVPMHYGDIVGTEEDAFKLQELLAGKIEVKILKKENAK